MNIRLNIQKESFKKALVKLGYNYNIKQYDDFIERIRTIVVNELKQGVQENRLEAVLIRIFRTEIKIISLLSLQNKDLLTYISSEYLTILIEEGYLDLYLEEVERSFTKAIQENAYAYTILSKLKFQIDSTKISLLNAYPVYSDKNSSTHISAMRCINANKILLSESEKEEVNTRINIKLKEILLTHLFLTTSIQGRINLITLGNEKRVHQKINRLLINTFFEEDLLNKEIFNLDIQLNALSDEEKENRSSLNIFRNYLKKPVEDIYPIIKDIFQNENVSLIGGNSVYIGDRDLLLEKGKNYNFLDLNNFYISVKYGDLEKKISFQEIVDIEL